MKILGDLGKISKRYNGIDLQTMVLRRENINYKYPKLKV